MTRSNRRVIVDDDSDTQASMLVDDDSTDLREISANQPQLAKIKKEYIESDDEDAAHHASANQNGNHTYFNGGTAGLDSDDDDDPVVQEIPVYLSKELAQSLYLFQYPNRKPEQHLQEPNPISVRMKPSAQRFEIDIPVNTRDPHYSKHKGEALGVGMDNESIKTAYDIDRNDFRMESDRTKLLDKITLQSTLLPPSGNYYIGAMRDGKIASFVLLSLVD